MDDIKLLIGKQYPEAVIEAVQNAKHSIKILMYDWRWYESQVGARIQKLNRAILAASKRGVKIQAVVNSPEIVAILCKYGVEARVTNVQRKMHAKLVIVDERDLYIGSHNFSISAFELNYEMSLALSDPLVVEKASRFFDRVCLT